MEVPILLPKIFNEPFTYLKDKKIKDLKLGDLVIVPFGKNRKSVLFGTELKKQKKRLN